MEQVRRGNERARNQHSAERQVQTGSSSVPPSPYSETTSDSQTSWTTSTDLLLAQVRRDNEIALNKHARGSFRAVKHWEEQETAVSDRVGVSTLRRVARAPRDPFKARGSLLSRDRYDTEIPAQSKTDSHSSNVGPKKARPVKHHHKEATVDVFIPSTVSVGHLARLLNVRLGV